MFGRLAMGFANVRAGTRVLMLVLVQATPTTGMQSPTRSGCSERSGEQAKQTKQGVGGDLGFV